MENTNHFGLEGRLVGLVQELLKVNAGEEGVAHDFLAAVLPTPKTLSGISAKKGL
jgi:hypothetical protein